MGKFGHFFFITPYFSLDRSMAARITAAVRYVSLVFSTAGTAIEDFFLSRYGTYCHGIGETVILRIRIYRAK